MGCYFMANIRMVDEATYRKYLDECDGIFAKHGGRYVAVDEAPLVLEGEWNYSRAVLIHFESEADFRSWYDSPEYRRIREYRLAGARCDSILIHDKAGGTVPERTVPADADLHAEAGLQAST